ncbi:MAG TPA: hypothetical protein VF331_13665 [Polyangiales bacterium]
MTQRHSAVLRWLVTALAVAGAAAWFVPDIDGADVWWHIASGREFFAHGAVPRSDPLSFTASQPWVNHEWLWGVFAFSLYRIDPQVLAWGNFAVLSLIFWLGFECALAVQAGLFASTLALWLAAVNGHWFFDLRPHLFTILFAMLLLRTRQLPWAHWLWPPIIALWCNIHAGYVFGLGMIGLLALVSTLQLAAAEMLGVPALRAAFASQRARWFSVAVCMLAICANPWGYHLLEFPLSYAPGAGRSLYADQIVEWQAFGWQWDELRLMGVSWLGTFRGRYLLLVALLSPSLLRQARRDPYLVVLACVSILMALSARRFVALSSLLCTPLVACTLAAGGRWLRARVRLLQSTNAGLVVALSLAACLPPMWSRTRTLPQLFERWSSVDLYPQAATHYLASLGAPLHVLNFETWGGYVMIHAPRCRVFFDGRASTVYDEELYVDYLDLMNGRGSLPAQLAKYRPDAVLVPDLKIVDSLLGLSQPWKVVYADEVAALLLPPDSPWLSRPLPDPERVLAHEPQWLRHRAALAFEHGDGQRAIALLQQALGAAPLLLGAYTDLMTVFGQRDQPEAVALVASAALSSMPQRRAQVHAHWGRQYESRGQLPQALVHYRAALTGHPLSDESGLRARIERLERTVRGAAHVP